jgi:hypothetical protein
MQTVMNSPNNILSQNSLPKVRKSNFEVNQPKIVLELQRNDEKSPNTLLPRNSVVPVSNTLPLLNASAFVN